MRTSYHQWHHSLSLNLARKPHSFQSRWSLADPGKYEDTNIHRCSLVITKSTLRLCLCVSRVKFPLNLIIRCPGNSKSRAINNTNRSLESSKHRIRYRLNEFHQLLLRGPGDNSIKCLREALRPRRIIQVSVLSWISVASSSSIITWYYLSQLRTSRS